MEEIKGEYNHVLPYTHAEHAAARDPNSDEKKKKINLYDQGIMPNSFNLISKQKFGILSSQIRKSRREKRCKD